MSTPSLPQALEQLFRSQINAAKELHQILSDENAALVNRDYKGSQSVIQAKQLKTAEIESLIKKQTELLATTGLSFSRESFDNIINSCSNLTGEALRKLRDTLENTMQECQNQNLINGQIISVNQQSAKIALGILRGQLSSDELTYGSGGQPISDKSAHPITKA